ncbi:hypothetical protein EKO27_g7141 [Xylaria grammica]|uniref:40S ribosomal protein S18 n=1 Tax=Xylaria grammica TaxID=363999 RepID=A0A439D0I6_9PEZI|nr:hypothetical protein EKO27_g7141 [Xylaria grammica]
MASLFPGTNARRCCAAFTAIPPPRRLEITISPQPNLGHKYDAIRDTQPNNQRVGTRERYEYLLSLVSGEKSNFQFIIRLLNTNVDGKEKALYSLTSIKGIGPRFADLILKKADIDKNKRAGELTAEELERVVQIVKDPAAYKIPAWFLNRQRDIVTGQDSHAISSAVDSKLREDLERLKKIRAHRGLRHYWGLRVRGQHTKTTGRRGRTVGVSKKKG